MDIYERQEGLGLEIPSSALCVGVGGVGSWAALFLALLGTKRLALVDPDLVEYSNLNRTVFRLSDVGRPKVEALTDLILERRECEIISVRERIELATEMVDLLDSFQVVLDCRDRPLATLPDLLRKRVSCVAGYDGHSITLHLNPGEGTVFGDGEVRYRVGSFILPPVLAALFLVSAILYRPELGREEQLFSGRLVELWKRIWR